MMVDLIKDIGKRILGVRRLRECLCDCNEDIRRYAARMLKLRRLTPVRSL